MIANLLGELVTAYQSPQAPTVLFAWVNAFAYALQIYYDFSGYSDMAIGLGHMLGFSFPENFRYPFCSRNITEFWRRWHMTMSFWVRDYVYIPLGGNRCSRKRWIFNVMVVWMLTGLWHGAAWNFVAWGICYGLLLLAEKFFLNRLLDKAPKALRHLYVTVVIAVSFVIFSGVGAKGMIADMGALFGANGLAFWSKETSYYVSGYLIALAVAIFGATPVLKNLFAKLHENEKTCKVLNVLEPIFHVVLLLIVTAYFVDGSFSPFLYFRF